eukprot:TRINITY_DN13624_c0_g1_i1.p1 TRINITY_DN13624_c0_g1~~TRINITY_DN13624_c0_g1_i1.p1  ORF type:complete len:510 (-),score=65.28 TRINITY_DN13624_c0_g1_i1:399-1928(-)
MRSLAALFIFIIFFVLSSLVYLHTSGAVSEGLDPVTRRKQVIASQRRTAEAALASERVKEAAFFDSSRGDVKSSCAPFATWRNRYAPCTGREGGDVLPNFDSSTVSDANAGEFTISTDHFPREFTQFVVPHYETLGEWRISYRQPTLWNVAVSNPSHLRTLRCGTLWLSMNRLFDSAEWGYLHGPLLRDVDRTVQALREALAPSGGLTAPAYLHALTVLVTHQSAWIEGIRVAVPALAAVLQGDADGASSDPGAKTLSRRALLQHPNSAAPSHLEQVSSATRRQLHFSGPDVAVVRAFAAGLRVAFAQLLPRPVTEWRFDSIRAIQTEICRSTTKAFPLGYTRRGSMNVGYGQDAPAALGVEVPYLVKAFEGWLHHTAATNCSHPIQFALDAYINIVHIHPFTDCNTRTAAVVMSALLLKHDYPPLFLFNPATFRQLTSLRQAAFLGLRVALYDDFTNNLRVSAETLLATARGASSSGTGRFRDSTTAHAAGLRAAEVNALGEHLSSAS